MSPILKRAGQLALLGVLALPAGARAQVGHAPESSPYSVLKARQTLAFTGGYLAGSAGDAGVGPTDGPLAGIRFDARLGGPFDVVVGLSYANLDRAVIDPSLGPEDNLVGTFKQSVFLIEGGFNMVLTGDKTWHGLAPYFGASLGLALGGAVPEDSSGFSFSTKFQIGPQVGIQWHIADRFNLRLEGRDILWKLSYPARFFVSPGLGEDPVLQPGTGESQWTHHPTFVVALGYAIRT